MEAIITIKIKEKIHLNVKSYCAKNKLSMLDFYSDAAKEKLELTKKKK